MTATYMQAICAGFPSIQCHSLGEGEIYEDIIWDAGPPLPSKQALDEWITANPELARDRHITVLAFRNRFTQTEKVTMDMASIDNPSAPMQSRQLAATLRVTMKDTDAATFIDLNRPETRAGVIMLETYKIIGAGRAAVILDSIINDTERPLTTYV